MREEQKKLRKRKLFPIITLKLQIKTHIFIKIYKYLIMSKFIFYLENKSAKLFSSPVYYTKDRIFLSLTL